MIIQAKLFQNVQSVRYFLDGAEVRKVRIDGKIAKDGQGNPIWEFTDDELVTIGQEDIERVVSYTESWGFPVSAKADRAKKLTHERLKTMCDHLAETLQFAAKTSKVNGRKFTRFSLNKPIELVIALNGETLMNTTADTIDGKKLNEFYNTFRLTYANEGAREVFTIAEISEGLMNIFLTAERLGEVFEL